MGRYVDDRFNRLALKQLRQDPHEEPAVLHHVGETRSVAEIMMLHRESANRVTANAQSAPVQEMIACRGQPYRATLIVRAAQDHGNRNDPFLEDFAFPVDISQ